MTSTKFRSLIVLIVAMTRVGGLPHAAGAQSLPGGGFRADPNLTEMVRAGG